MADFKITQLVQVNTIPVGAIVPLVDVNDTSTAPAGPGGSDKSIAASSLSVSRQATTGVNGFALQNGTPTIISWNVPNDNALHRFIIFAIIHVTSAETGGLINVTFVGFTGAAGHTSTLFAAGLGTDTGGQVANSVFGIANFNTVVAIQQGSALTVGAATMYAEIWGS